MRRILDPASRELNSTMRDAIMASYPVWHGGLIPPEQHEAFVKELTSDGDWYCEHDMLFVAARKKGGPGRKATKASL